jgi:DNA-binding GntR family transcriptional regulator
MLSVITRLSLHKELVPLLRDMVIGGELQPGDKIHEPKLCERFGVSRTPLREALKVLAAEGLVQITPNRGAMVARITRQEIDELFPIMGVLEGLAGELAAERMKKRDFARLADLHNRMVGHYERREWASYIKLNKAIHDSIFAIAGNESLTALYNTLMVRIHSVRYIAKKSESRWAEAVDDHNRLMAALEARDGALAGAILREHLRHKAEMVHEALGEGLDGAAVVPSMLEAAPTR